MTLLAILTNPTTYLTLQSELDTAITNNLVTLPMTNSQSHTHLPYLQSVIRESIRFFPPIACGAFYKDVPAGGDVLCGRYLPQGTKVSTMAATSAITRSRAIWGEDADCFRPERWGEAEGMDDGGERVRMMGRVVDLSFGGGQFLCSGKGIALMEVCKVVPEVGFFLPFFSSFSFCFPLCLVALSFSLGAGEAFGKVVILTFEPLVLAFAAVSILAGGSGRAHQD